MFLLRSLVLVILSGLSLSASANILGTMQTFQPTPDLTDFETVHSSRSLLGGQFNLGFFAAYQKNDLSVFDSLGTANEKYLAYKDSSWQYDLVAAWGMTDHWTFTLTNSGILSQQAEDNQSVNGTTQKIYITKGTQVVRPGLKYSFRSGSEGWGAALLGSVDVPTTSEDPYTGLHGKQIYNIEAALDWYKDQSGLGFNLGYRNRKPGDQVANQIMYPLKDQLTYSAAYVYGLKSDVRYHFELFGATPLQKNNYLEGGHENSLEALAAIRFMTMKNLWVHIGATAEILAKGLSPDYRAFAGINLFFGERTKAAPPKEPLPPATLDEEVEPTPLPPTVNVESLEAHPAQLEVFSGYTQNVSVSGGAAPYTYEVKNGFGSFDSEQMLYRAPYQVGQTELLIRDSAGSTTMIPIRVTAIPKAHKTLALKHLNFVFNTADLTPGAKKELKNNFSQLRDIKIKKIILIGHTDNIGSAEYNQQLSKKRAETVRRELIEYLNLREDQVDAIGAGLSQPAASNKTEAGRAANRRVELRLYRQE